MTANNLISYNFCWQALFFPVGFQWNRQYCIRSWTPRPHSHNKCVSIVFLNNEALFLYLWGFLRAPRETQGGNSAINTQLYTINKKWSKCLYLRCSLSLESPPPACDYLLKSLFSHFFQKALPRLSNQRESHFLWSHSLIWDCKEIDPVHPKGNQPWIFIGRTDAEAEAPGLWPPDVKNWLTGKDPDAGKDWRQEKKGTTEGEMVGWHHWLDGHEFEQAQGDSEGSLVCCSPRGHKEMNMS